MKTSLLNALCLVFIVLTSARADGERDNHPESVRRVPRLGVEVPAKDRNELEAGLAVLDEMITELRKNASPEVKALLPDVIIFHRAVHDALEYQEFFKAGEIQVAKKHLARGIERAQQLSEGKAPWTRETGLVVRGFVSRLDGSVQPYGLVIPESYRPDETKPRRLDIWFHGRGETLSENNFLQQRLTKVGYYAPKDTIVLHPYGRYSNAFKFAGEVDVLEALASVKQRYAIDDNRISVRGFSMGGAACWQFAVHYASDWFAANPGAGFSETPEFLKFFQKQTLDPTAWERQLWHWYDCTDWCLNLSQCPTIAYSGENDIQKQAADIMATALQREGMDLTHIIGPKMGHRIDPGSVKLIDEKMARIAQTGRVRTPRHVNFVTYTLKYNRMNWVTVTGLEQHWEKGIVQASLGPIESRIHVKTGNITGLNIDFAAGETPFPINQPVVIQIDHQRIIGPAPKTDRSLSISLIRTDGTWSLGSFPNNKLRKTHDLQGPIDDAFMDSFLFVKPTGKSENQFVTAWAQSEMTRAVEHWRRHFRGHVRIKKDRDVTKDDIANHNLILWGDPSSNQFLKSIVDQLPITWTATDIQVGNLKAPAKDHALIAIAPNPKNPKRYVVLNSSFTFREFAYLNNARQVPMLPDWAVIDLNTPPNTVWPGRVVWADFFDEQWNVKLGETPESTLEK